MADTKSPSSEYSPGDASNSPSPNRPPQPAPQDWEVLSMSTMSASTLGLPGKHDEHQKGESISPDATEDSGLSASEAASFGIEQFTEECRPLLQSSGNLSQETYPEVVEKELDDEVQDEDMHPLFGHCVAAEEPVPDEGEPVSALKKKSVKISWWKRQTVVRQPQSQRYSAVWSIALLAAVVGVIFIGHRWHRERYLNHQLRLELSTKEEKLNDLMYQVNRMKDAMTGRRRVGVTRNSLF